MAIVRPLTINNGQIERASASDTVLGPDHSPVTNETGGSLVIGTPVYQTGVANEVAKAHGNAVSTAKVLGLLMQTLADAASGYALTDGRMTATTAEWDAVTGQTGGLTPGANYYLDPTTAGMLTTTAPTADGHVVAPVGQAKSTTDFEITILTTIKL